ncbi:MAG: Verru_Chthon cassette protein A [Chthoniobacter sp.]|nr:Verru_Chthon cassette protein A [Chthoniobacter sp.]
MHAPTTSRRSWKSGPQPCGAALIMTLGMLVLLSGVVLAFLLMVRTEYGAAKAYEGGTNARLLADSALNLVIGQIREASTQPDLAWISQPGLMRTFDTSGQAVKSYKLYSADSLVEDGNFDPMLGTDLPSAAGGANSWKTQPGLWTDLNQPVTDLARVDPFDTTKQKKLMIYPIFDGNHVQEIADPTDPAPGNKPGQMSLNKDGTADIEGFKIEDYATRQATMPVKWLYLLKDGTLVPAKAAGTAGDVEVVVPSGKEKTAQGEVNSIVGRVAFWTDDETAKVNVNTASEGTFSDTPVANSQSGFNAGPYASSTDTVFENDLAEMQCAQKEFQRYPGHPATTCLSTIFGRQILLRSDVGGNRARMAEEIFKLIPRVSGAVYAPSANGPDFTSSYDYSSVAGTRRAGPHTNTAAADTTDYSISTDGERLYASIDEFLFSPVFAPPVRKGWQLAPAVAGRDTTAEMLEMAKFFLTANSKAPEQNLFNLPRVSIWPEQVSPTRRTAFDTVIAFCSTVGPKTASSSLPFYFTREDPASATKDLSARNRAIYTYLQGLTGRQIPGAGGGGTSVNTFAAKYGLDRDQILTEILDYIRCTNLVDQSDPLVEASYTPPEQSYDYVTKRGQVVPLKIDSTRGFGRIATISELSLGIINKNKDGDTSGSANLEFCLLPKLFCPMAGFSALANDLRIKFKDIKIQVSGASGGPKMPFGSGTDQPSLYNEGRMSQIDAFESKVGGTIGINSLTEDPNPGGVPPNVGSPDDSVPPTGEVTVTGGSDSYLTVGGTVTVEILAPANSNGSPVQTMTFKFPETQVPMPKPSGGQEVAVGGTGAKKRGGGSPDVLRSLVATGTPSGSVGLQGDMRLIAARETVDESLFAPALDNNYKDKNRRRDGTHSRRQGFKNLDAGATFGTLVKGLDGYDAGTRPDIPGGVDGVTNALGMPGDWDNGPGFIPDGPYCNKPDEGANRHMHAQHGNTWAEGYAPYIGYVWCPQDAVIQQTKYFSPNRQVSSPVMFGSLPTGVLQNKPWQTLLFRPAKAYLPGGTTHPGSGAGGVPSDHLLLDLFWMPVVEPYAISEPFATAGKINLNQQIVPFTNVKRTTGLRAVMKSVKITAMNPLQQDAFSDGGAYIKNYKICGTVGAFNGEGGGQGVILRRDIDLDNTMKLIVDRLDKNRPFISASEICDIPLVPKDVPLRSGVPKLKSHLSAGFSPTTALSEFDGKLKTFWEQHKLTGDNSFERPYSNIYPRLTTRSNTYTVHVRVQTLARSARNSSYVIKARDNQPTGEFRGSFLIERYLDANLAGFVDSAGKPKSVPTSGDTKGLALGPYRFRVLSSKQLVP